MIDDATSRLFARFVRHDSSAENMRVLWSYLEKFGRPVAFYTDKASIFQTAQKRKRDEPGVDKEAVEMPPTQIGRALRELGITWIGAHSPQAKGRVERNFQTAQDRLVKGMRVAGVKTIEEANRYLEEDYLVWWERELTVEPANPDDAHRPLDKSHHLAASLSHVETRQVEKNYTLWVDAQLYEIERAAIVSGLRGATVRVEKRLDGSLAVRYGEKYLPVQLCVPAKKKAAVSKPAKPTGKRRQARRGSDWNRNFDLKKAPKTWQAAQGSGGRLGRVRMNPIRRRVAGRQSSPYTGKLSARPAGKPGDSLAKENLRRSLPRHSSATAKNHTEAPSMRFQGMAESIWSDVAKSKSKPNPGVGPCRLPLVGPEPR